MRGEGAWKVSSSSLLTPVPDALHHHRTEKGRGWGKEGKARMGNETARIPWNDCHCTSQGSHQRDTIPNTHDLKPRSRPLWPSQTHTDLCSINAFGSSQSQSNTLWQPPSPSWEEDRTHSGAPAFPEIWLKTGGGRQPRGSVSDVALKSTLAAGAKTDNTCLWKGHSRSNWYLRRETQFDYIN